MIKPTASFCPSGGEPSGPVDRPSSSCGHGSHGLLYANAYSADTSVSQCAPPFQHSGNYCFYIIKNMNTTNETIKIIDYSYRGVKIFTVRHPLHSVDKHKSFPPFSSKNC